MRFTGFYSAKSRNTRNCLEPVSSTHLDVYKRQGVSISVGHAMVRVLTGIYILWFLVPGYVFAISISFVCLLYTSGQKTDGNDSVHGKTLPKRVFLIVTQPAGVCAIISVSYTHLGWRPAGHLRRWRAGPLPGGGPPLRSLHRRFGGQRQYGVLSGRCV